MMPLGAPESANPRLEALGFYFGTSGAHAGRSLMLADLVVVLNALPPASHRTAYRQAIVEGNVLAKSTLNNRTYAAKRMAQLYGLDDRICLFRNFRRLWEHDPASLPVLAVLLALARDGLFRAASGLVLETPAGAPVSKDAVAAALDAHVAGRMSAETLKHAAANVCNSWVQAGYLTESTLRTRTRALGTGPAAAAFAMFLGWLEGTRGTLLLKTLWASTLDRSNDERLELITRATRLGMLEFLNAGGVMEMRFPGYLTPEEQRL